MACSGRIEELPKNVIAKIAAGEVVERPSSVIKELIENSLDAAATEIKVEIDHGGLSYLKVTDNGCGVDKNDFPLLCKRFATSKISAYRDIKTVRTFGFRGEALSSISSLSKMTVTSRTSGTKCSYKASFMNGELCGKVLPCAGFFGTEVVVENMFYNIPLRQRVFNSNPSEERNLCVQIVKRYAISNPLVNFIYKKQRKALNELCSPLSKKGGKTTTRSMIRLFYGTEMADSVCRFEGQNDEYDIKFEGYTSNTNLKLKQNDFIVFVNKRLIRWSKLCNDVLTLYKNFVHKKYKIFFYLSLSIDSSKIDVNVHPKKEEILILDQGEIEEIVLSQVKSAVFSTSQSVIKSVGYSPENDFTFNIPSEKSDNFHVPSENVPSEETDFTFRAPSERVQINKCDPLLKTLAQESPRKTVRIDSNKSQEGIIKAYYKYPEKRFLSPKKHFSELTSKRMKSDLFYETANEIFEDLKTSKDEFLTEIAKNCVFLGHIDNQLVLVQFKKKLLSVDLNCLISCYVKQQVLKNFKKLPSFAVSRPVLIRDCVEKEFDSERTGDTSTVALSVESFLLSRRTLLENFAFAFDDENRVTHIPDIILGIKPLENRLGNFLINIVCLVNWKNEKEVVKEMTELLEMFYLINDEKLDEGKLMEIRQILFPQIQSAFIPKRSPLEAVIIREISNIEKFYSSFERC